MRQWRLLVILALLPGCVLAQATAPRETAPPTTAERPVPPQAPAGPPGGVIRPPAGVDPGIQAPAPVPAPGTTPVIPPPGTPGGDMRVQPR